MANQTNPLSQNVASPLTEEERLQVQRFLSDPTVFPTVYKAWVTSWIEANPPLIPISQITGFSAFTASGSSIITNQSTSTTTYTDLTTVGPQVASLPDGEYLILYGARMSSTIGETARMSVQVNSDSATDNDGVSGGDGTLFYGVKALLKTLSNDGDNTVTLKYRGVTGAGGTAAAFSDRWLIVVKYANL